MARPGVSYFDVAQAANAIQTASEYPTIDRIRQKLGTGSNSTIAAHLKQWKLEYMPTVSGIQKTTLPTALVSQLQSMWDELRASAKSEFDTLERAYKAEIASLNAGAEDKVSELSKAQHLIESYKKHIEEMDQKLGLAKEQVDEKEAENTELQSRLSNTESTLSSKNETLSALREQLNNVTASLEHFHTAAQKQRNDETLQHASKINRLEQKIQTLDQKKIEENERHQQALIEKERATFKADQLLIDGSQTKQELSKKIEESAIFKAKLESCNAALAALKADHEKEMNTRRDSEARAEGFLQKLREREGENQRLVVKLEEESEKLELLGDECDILRKEILTLTAKLSMM